jgi:hypothetical protein
MERISQKRSKRQPINREVLEPIEVAAEELEVEPVALPLGAEAVHRDPGRTSTSSRLEQTHPATSLERRDSVISRLKSVETGQL